jgi:hypothetical protein
MAALAFIRNLALPMLCIRIMRCLWSLFVVLTGCNCLGQSLTVGAIGGFRATSDIDGSGPNGPTSVSRRYVVGPAVEVDLPHGIGFEIAALYRREGYLAYPFTYFYAVSAERANSLECPILVKYRLPSSSARLFVEAGYAPRVAFTSYSTTTAFVPHIGIFTSDDMVEWPVSHGIVAGVGAEFGIKRLHISPSIRYTHWSHTVLSGGSAYLRSAYQEQPYQSAHNQFEVILNVGWKLHRSRPGVSRQ